MRKLIEVLRSSSVPSVPSSSSNDTSFRRFRRSKQRGKLGSRTSLARKGYADVREMDRIGAGKWLFSSP